MKIIFWIVIFVVSLSVEVLGADGPRQYVTIKSPSSITSARCSEGENRISVTIAPGYHVQANPASTPNLIATSVVFSDTPQIHWQSPEYPSGKPYKLKGSTSEISTYAGAIEIRVSFLVSDQAKKGRYPARGKLRFQPCDEKTCFFPVTVPISTSVRIP
jgi:hypothetical protein